MNSYILWTFRTKRFTIRWIIEELDGYRYDGYDDDGSIQEALKSGALVAFDSKLAVYLDGEEIAADYLGGSVYGADEVATFRDHIGMNARGHGSYFSDMVRQAVSEARSRLCNVPRLRCEVVS